MSTISPAQILTVSLLTFAGLLSALVIELLSRNLPNLRTRPLLGVLFVLYVGTIALAVLGPSSGPHPTTSSAPTPSTQADTIRSTTTTVVPATTHAPTPAQPPETSAPSPLPYRADWTPGLDGWFGSADWKTVRGMLVNDGTSSSIRMTITAPIVLDSTPNYVVETDIKVVHYSENSAANSFGLVVRGSEDGGGYGVGQCDQGPFLTMVSCAPNQPADDIAVIWTAEDTNSVVAATAFRPGTSWHHYRVEAKDDSIRLVVDGGVVLRATDNKYLDGERVGLWSSGCQINVRNFRVNAL